jgi:hypothetical protein|tara:strand:+ start:1085 stop:1468 length:384 start_codon:yes stop_codon:yes gene_type:complete
MSGLTFDWDDTDLENPVVVKALNYLEDNFGWERVWVRTSSSGGGLHVVIADLTIDMDMTQLLVPDEMDTETQFYWRKVFSEEPWSLECRGRFISDSARSQTGFTTSRIFGVKNGQEAGPWGLWRTLK